LPVKVDSIAGLTFNDGSIQATAPRTGMVNRIINGDMRIDQRNEGASVAPVVGSSYPVDRWALQQTSARITGQRNAGSVTPPSGFVNYLGFTTTTADVPASGDIYQVQQVIEGFNCADLGWGTTNAQPITVSFWVRSSLPGLHSGSVGNDSNTRLYVFSFTISVANTWEYKTITIPGDTIGTWLTNNNPGIKIGFSLGIGSIYTGSAGSWQGSILIAASGSVNLVATSGATFYITGVQLEKGSTATPFEYREYGRELRRCRRYFRISRCGSAFGYLLNAGYFEFTNNLNFAFDHSEMRTAPTVSTVGTFNGEILGGNATLIGVSLSGTMFCRINFSTAAAATVGRFQHLRDAGSNNSRILFSSEL
jgi:hypothetical protein